jgi:hypothetical protein
MMVKMGVDYSIGHGFGIVLTKEELKSIDPNTYFEKQEEFLDEMVVFLEKMNKSIETKQVIKLPKEELLLGYYLLAEDLGTPLEEEKYKGHLKNNLQHKILFPNNECGSNKFLGIINERHTNDNIDYFFMYLLNYDYTKKPYFEIEIPIFLEKKVSREATNKKTGEKYIIPKEQYIYNPIIGKALQKRRNLTFDSEEKVREFLDKVYKKDGPSASTVYISYLWCKKIFPNIKFDRVKQYLVRWLW